MTDDDDVFQTKFIRFFFAAPDELYEREGRGVMLALGGIRICDVLQ